MQRASVDFPLPLSPTSARHSPRWTVNETPWSANGAAAAVGVGRRQAAHLEQASASVRAPLRDRPPVPAPAAARAHASGCTAPRAGGPRRRAAAATRTAAGRREGNAATKGQPVSRSPGRGAVPGMPAAAGARRRASARRRATCACMGAAGRGRPASLDPTSTTRPRVHHGHAVRDPLDDREVVAHVDERRPVLAAQRVDEVEHLRLRRHVEAGRRLVEHDDGRVRQASAMRDRYALLLPPAELVRVAAPEAPTSPAAPRSRAARRRARRGRRPRRGARGPRRDARRSHRGIQRRARILRNVRSAGAPSSPRSAPGDARSRSSPRRAPAPATTAVPGARMAEQRQADRRLAGSPTRRRGRRTRRARSRSRRRDDGVAGRLVVDAEARACEHASGRRHDASPQPGPADAADDRRRPTRFMPTVSNAIADRRRDHHPRLAHDSPPGSRRSSAPSRPPAAAAPKPRNPSDAIHDDARGEAHADVREDRRPDVRQDLAEESRAASPRRGRPRPRRIR